MTLWAQVCGWVRISVLEGRLQRWGYRRLHEQQVTEAQNRSRRVIHDLADAVIRLQTVADEVEDVLRDLDGEDDDRSAQ